MNQSNNSELFNKSGRKRYMNPDAPQKVIQYITRYDRPDDDLIAWGGIGVVESLGVPAVIGQFRHVQNHYMRGGSFGRYIDHEVFSFSHRDEQMIYESGISLDHLARRMAQDFYDTDHCQVVYGIHRPEGREKHLHIHFAVNTVSFMDEKKRRENRSQTKARSERFQKILADEIHKSTYLF